MASSRIDSVGLALVGSAVVASLAWARAAGSDAPQASAATPAASFATPVRVLAGSEPMGIDRLYPSPVLRDMDGDGRLDVVLGDLWGAITIAPGQPGPAGGGAPTWGPDTPLLARDGKELDFSNW